MNQNRTLKIILVGPSSVGKTSLINQYKLRKFQENNVSTVGVDLQIIKNVCINKKIYDIAIWDTAGQEKYQSIVSISCRDSDAALLCFDLSDNNSVKSLDKWLVFLKQHCPTHLKVLIVGTKKDLPQMYTREQTEKIRTQLSEDHQECLELFLTSSKSGEGLQEVMSRAFELAATAKYNNDEDSQLEGVPRQSNNQNRSVHESFKLSQKPPTEPVWSGTSSQKVPDTEQKTKEGCC